MSGQKFNSYALTKISIYYTWNVLFTCLLLGGTIASKPVQRQVAAHLCELEPKGRSLAGLPRGEAKGRGSCAGSWTLRQTWRNADTGAGAGESTCEGVKDQEVHQCFTF